MDPITNYVRDGKPLRAAHLLSGGVGADGRAELVAFATLIGMKAKWIQKRGTAHEHFDLFGGRIQQAVDAGAIRIDRKRLVQIIRHKRELLGLVKVPRKVIVARSKVRELRSAA